MIIIKGNGVSSGISVGTLSFYHRGDTNIKSFTVEDPNQEWQRFKEAQEKAHKQLGELAQKAREEVGEAEAVLFETHQMLIEDLDYEEAIQTIILEEKWNAETAVLRISDTFSEMFASMDDSYMRERAADVKDVSNRILNILCNVSQDGIVLEEPVILAADDLAPSETIQLDKSKILGFVTAQGSGSSHTAILARAMGIPAIVGLGDSLKEKLEGCEVIIDGDEGILYVDPYDKMKEEMIKKQEMQQEQRKQLETLKGQPNITEDGQEIRIFCNISSPEDVHAVLENDGSGIGLFRSEFLYLNTDRYPTEEEQFEAYKTVLTKMNEKEVIIRTCDIGADKQIAYFNLPQEENPAMGQRAIRISLNRPDFFKTQLRALYRASSYGNLNIMFPMITSVWEIQKAKEICTIVKKELKEEGVPYSENVRIGVMIETPSAVMISDLLAKEVDFFSCGTNDLTQYTLACDRQNNDLGDFYDSHHIAILRMLKMVCDNAHANGIWVGICGELASDIDMTETFLAIGIDELSVSPREVLPLRNRIRSINLGKNKENIITSIMTGKIEENCL